MPEFIIQTLKYAPNDKPQHSAYILLNNLNLKLIFSPKGYAKDHTSLHVHASRVSSRDQPEQQLDTIFSINCCVQYDGKDGKLITVKNETILVNLDNGKSSKKVKQWQKFVSHKDLEFHANEDDGQFKLYWTIEQIDGCFDKIVADKPKIYEITKIPDPSEITDKSDDKSDNKSVEPTLPTQNPPKNSETHPKTKTYDPDPRIFEKFLFKTESIYTLSDKNDEIDKIVDNFRLLLRHIYGGRNGLAKMFVDDFQIFNDKGKILIKHTINHNSNKILNFSTKNPRNLEPFQSVHEYETELISNLDFQETKVKKRHYIYIILDPYITGNLQERILPEIQKILKSEKSFNLLNLIQKDLFQDFLNGIFYIGLGQRGRSWNHFSTAKRDFLNRKTKKDFRPSENENQKNNERIQQIWSKSNRTHGPILLHFIEGINVFEAQQLEGYLIQALGLNGLNNRVLGKKDFKIPEQKRKELGVFLLRKAFVKLVLEGEDQILFDEVIVRVNVVDTCENNGEESNDE